MKVFVNRDLWSPVGTTGEVSHFGTAAFSKFEIEREFLPKEHAVVDGFGWYVLG
ncbi:MAG TPA: hypothetical protein VKQ08_03300 [Cyclobacteriaceae bacterium]|nr:hypothetical protein [Cyclobacteriaceae bacterium]